MRSTRRGHAALEHIIATSMAGAVFFLLGQSLLAGWQVATVYLQSVLASGLP